MMEFCVLDIIFMQVHCLYIRALPTRHSATLRLVESSVVLHSAQASPEEALKC